jgi:hypothetical protein
MREFPSSLISSTRVVPASGPLRISSQFYVRSRSDLPASTSGVIQLEDNATYIIIGNIDLQGDRLLSGLNTAILGNSSENSRITSTGLTVGTPLLTSRKAITIRDITFYDADTCIYIDDDGGAGAPLALDWRAVNFLNIPNVGEIGTVDNFIFDTGAFLNSQNLRFSGTVGTIGIFNSLFRGSGAVGNIFSIESTADITRRFRIIYSSIIAFSSTVGINFNTSAGVMTESYILDTVNFSGGGTYIAGVLTDSNKSLFTNCVGISNTSTNGLLYMSDNLTATTIANTLDYFKVAGTTTPRNGEKFSHSNNRLTCDAVIERKYLINATLSFSSVPTNVIAFGIYSSSEVDVLIDSKTPATANAAGRAESVKIQTVLRMKQNEFVEVWCRNISATNDVTVSDLSLIVTEIK